ncbi:MAG: hypothetical protein KJ847_04505 [Firmicutes bacterium]|nr:hypothetical protein [Bacillota bacterium]
MTYFISIFFPITLLVLAAWFMRINYNSYFKNWRKELSPIKLLYYGSQIFVKSSIIFGLIILIHNRFHQDSQIEVLLFVLLFILFSITQSAYSIGGFNSRIKYIFGYTLKMFHKKSNEVEVIADKIIKNNFSKYSFFVKTVVATAFLIIFLPNIGLFVISNIVYFLVIISLILLTFVLNNIIYFGLISLMIFQYQHDSMTLDNLNILVMTLSYLVLVIGLTIETRFDNRMCHIVGSRVIKQIDFKNGFIPVLYKNQYYVYQHVINKNYYIYYRLHGIVLLFESYYDAKLSKAVVRKMIFKGKQYLKLNGE